MYHNPRRPFYNTRSEDIPNDNSLHHSAVIDSKRFWKLVKKLTLRQEETKEAKAKDQDDVASAAG